MTAIRVRSLRKRYGDVTALDGITLSIGTGEVYGLLGPNGAGKTTTIAILTGQIRPDAGEATVLDRDVRADPVGVRERVGILPEQESPPSFMTPREYLQFVGSVRGMADGEVDARIEGWSERLWFENHLDTLATDLSRGQQQKVMIAGAFLDRPSVVFIDEPLVNLDPLVQERVKAYIRSYRSAGNTVLLSTHNIAVAAELCSHVGILSGGSLIDELTDETLGSGERLRAAFLDRVEPEPATPTADV